MLSLSLPIKLFVRIRGKKLNSALLPNIKSVSVSKDKKEEEEKRIRRQGDTKYSFPLTAGGDKSLKKETGIVCL